MPTRDTYKVFASVKKECSFSLAASQDTTGAAAICRATPIFESNTADNTVRYNYMDTFNISVFV